MELFIFEKKKYKYIREIALEAQIADLIDVHPSSK
jgi:hypothetical protein